MKYGKEHKLKKHDSSTQIYVGLKLQRRNLNSNLQHLKDLIPAVSYLLLVDFELHKDYMNIKYIGHSWMLKQQEDSDKQTYFYNRK